LAPVRLYVDLASLHNVFKQCAAIEEPVTLSVSEAKKQIKLVIRLEENNVTKIRL
jgi:hypothetical protein